jgi:hypothetical protein
MIRLSGRNRRAYSDCCRSGLRVLPDTVHPLSVALNTLLHNELVALLPVRF